MFSTVTSQFDIDAGFKVVQCSLNLIQLNFTFHGGRDLALEVDEVTLADHLAESLLESLPHLVDLWIDIFFASLELGQLAGNRSQSLVAVASIILDSSESLPESVYFFTSLQFQLRLFFTEISFHLSHELPHLCIELFSKELEHAFAFLDL
jgi:hypothetical protein